jgi:hypothetical protein
MGMDAIWTIAPREPLPPTEATLAAFFLDLHRYLVIDGRFTLISSPTAEFTRTNYYDFPGPPDSHDYLVSGPEIAPGTVVSDWFTLPAPDREALVDHAATVHYDGDDLNEVLRALPGAGVGTADVILLAWPGASLDQVAHAVAVPALAGPAEHAPGNEGCWSPYRGRVWDAGDWDEETDDPGAEDAMYAALFDPRLGEPGYLPEGSFWSRPVQMGFGTWAGRSGTDHYVPPVCDVLHRHLGEDLLIASEVF